MASSVYMSSEEYFEYSCNPCDSAWDHLEAVGFCTNCQEFLCGTCYKCHSRGKATRNHTLLDKADMPRKYITCDPCKTADENKEAVGFCTTCEEYLCLECFRSHSKSKVTKSHNLMDKDSKPRPFQHVRPVVGKLGTCGKGVEYGKTSPTYTYAKDICIKDEKDTFDCLIIGMTVISEDEIVLVDQNNCALKLFNVEKNMSTGVTRMRARPWGVAALPEDQVAVTFPFEHQIKMFAISTGLSVVRTLKTSGMCTAVQYTQGRLYISFENPVMFQIFELTGEARKTIKPSSEVHKYCKSPTYIAVNADKAVMFISDTETDKVICMDMNGNMVSVYQGELGRPHDISISPFGSLYLSIMKKHVVSKLALGLKADTVVLGSGDGLWYPCAMCFDIGRKRLYISSGCRGSKYRNYIKVFGWNKH